MEDTNQVEALAITWDTLRLEALPRSASLDLVEEVAQLMETAEPLSWRKSSYSTSNGGNCVEVGTNPHTLAVRDSKSPDGTTLAIASGKWLAFTRRMKASFVAR